MVSLPRLFFSMGSALFLLFFIIIELAATRVQMDCRSVSSINEYALTGHTYKTITGNHLTTCVALCDDDPRCYSINYKLTTRTCELSDSTRVTSPKDFIHKPSHVYLEHLYRPLGSCYENAPCQNGGICVNIPHNPGYQCFCRKDYTGELCEGHDQLKVCKRGSSLISKVNHDCKQLKLINTPAGSVLLVCTSPALGMADHRIPDSKITASSAGFWFHGVFKPHLARLRGSSAWVATLLDLNPYLQISFSPRKMLITGVATQGNPEHDWWTTSYILKYSFDEQNWMNYKKNGMVEVFLANTDRNTVMSHVLERPFIAIFLRFDAITKVYRTSLRVEVYGCDA